MLRQSSRLRKTRGPRSPARSRTAPSQHLVAGYPLLEKPVALQWAWQRAFLPHTLKPTCCTWSRCQCSPGETGRPMDESSFTMFWPASRQGHCRCCLCADGKDNQPVRWRAGQALFLSTSGTSLQLAVTAPPIAPAAKPDVAPATMRLMQSSARSAAMGHCGFAQLLRHRCSMSAPRPLTGYLADPGLLWCCPGAGRYGGGGMWRMRLA